MNKLYKAEKIYLVQLGVVQGPEALGIGKHSITWKTQSEIYFAKKIVSPEGMIKFKILTKKIFACYIPSSPKVGDTIIIRKSPVNEALGTNFKYISYKDMANAEKKMNSKDNEIKPKFVSTKEGLKLI